MPNSTIEAASEVASEFTTGDFKGGKLGKPFDIEKPGSKAKTKSPQKGKPQAAPRRQRDVPNNPADEISGDLLVPSEPDPHGDPDETPKPKVQPQKRRLREEESRDERKPVVRRQVFEDVYEPDSDGRTRDTVSEDEDPADIDDDGTTDKEVDPDDEERYALVERAVQLGLPLKQANKLDEDSLGSMIDVLERKLPAATTKPDDAQQPQEDAAPDITFDETEFYDGAVPKALKAIHGHYKAIVGKLEGRIAALERGGFDDPVERFASTSDEFASVIGKGANEGVDSKARLARKRVLEEVEILRAGYKAMKRNVPPDETLVKQVVRSLFPDRLRAVEKRAEVARGRSGKFLGRPGSRMAAGKETTQSALSVIRNTLREAGED